MIDQMIDIEGIDYLIGRPRYPFETCLTKWKTATGHKIYPKDMSTEHLENSIRMIERICKRERLKASNYIIYNRLVQELNKRRLSAW